MTTNMNPNKLYKNSGKEKPFKDFCTEYNQAKEAGSLDQFIEQLNKPKQGTGFRNFVEGQVDLLETGDLQTGDTWPNNESVRGDDTPGLTERGPAPADAVLPTPPKSSKMLMGGFGFLVGVVIVLVINKKSV